MRGYFFEKFPAGVKTKRTQSSDERQKQEPAGEQEQRTGQIHGAPKVAQSNISRSKYRALRYKGSLLSSMRAIPKAERFKAPMVPPLHVFDRTNCMPTDLSLQPRIVLC